MPRTPHLGAVKSARQLIAALRIRHPKEIDVELIAAHHDILVRRMRMQHEEGRLLRTAKHGIINVSDHAYGSNKWRFVIAHEIGHFIQHPDNDNFEACTRGDLSNYAGSGRETEANDFASELLMPAALFKKRCDRNRPCLRDVAEIAEEFNTSLTATALRFVRFSPEPCAVVHSTDGAVDWLDWSSNFQLAIKKRTRLDSRTYAGDLSAGKPVDDRPGQVDGEAWSNSRDAADLDIFEHSKKVSPRSVLTFLWHADR
jgi:Zn-dependent peptidase ImmA (M78 family)